MDKCGIQLSDLVENIVGKEEIPTIFSKALCCRCIKMSIYVVKDKVGLT